MFSRSGGFPGTRARRSRSVKIQSCDTLLTNFPDSDSRSVRGRRKSSSFGAHQVSYSHNKSSFYLRSLIISLRYNLQPVIYSCEITVKFLCWSLSFYRFLNNENVLFSFTLLLFSSNNKSGSLSVIIVSKVNQKLFFSLYRWYFTWYIIELWMPNVLWFC